MKMIYSFGQEQLDRMETILSKDFIRTGADRALPVDSAAAAIAGRLGKIIEKSCLLQISETKFARDCRARKSRKRDRKSVV